MSRLVICYFSPTGGTKKIAKIVAQAFPWPNVELDMLVEKEWFNFTFKEDDFVIFALPSYGGRIPSVLVPQLKKLQGHGAKTLMIAVYGNRAIDDTLRELKDCLVAADFKPLAAISAVAKHSLFPLIAADRPNDLDKQELFNFAREILNRLNHDELGEVDVPGNVPYREYHGTPFKPTANELCDHCGLCAKECPTGAIDIKHVTDVDKTKCISCMHCVNICPKHARAIDQELQALKYPSMFERCQEPQTNQLFITLK